MREENWRRIQLVSQVSLLATRRGGVDFDNRRTVCIRTGALSSDRSFSPSFCTRAWSALATGGPMPMPSKYTDESDSSDKRIRARRAWGNGMGPADTGIDGQVPTESWLHSHNTSAWAQ